MLTKHEFACFDVDKVIHHKIPNYAASSMLSGKNIDVMLALVITQCLLLTNWSVLDLSLIFYLELKAQLFKASLA